MNRRVDCGDKNHANRLPSPRLSTIVICLNFIEFHFGQFVLLRIERIQWFSGDMRTHNMLYYRSHLSTANAIRVDCNSYTAWNWPLSTVPIANIHIINWAAHVITFMFVCFLFLSAVKIVSDMHTMQCWLDNTFVWQNSISDAPRIVGVHITHRLQVQIHIYFVTNYTYASSVPHWFYRLNTFACPVSTAHCRTFFAPIK